MKINITEKNVKQNFYSKQRMKNVNGNCEIFLESLYH